MARRSLEARPQIQIRTLPPVRNDPESGDGRYLADMSIFQPKSVRLVEQALLEGPAGGMTGKQVWEAVDRAVPERAVYLILLEMASKGLVERETTTRKGRQAISAFRAL